MSSLHSDQEKAKVEHNELYATTSDDYRNIVVEEDAVADKRLLRKIDKKLVPFLSLLYLLSFLDRVNIGQAKLDNLVVDLGLKGNQYNIALVVFFVGYVITETPSNILLKKLKPTRWIPLIMVCWAIVMTLMGLVTNFAGLVATRFLLGLCESGLFPGICLYMSLWFRRSEQNLRISIFFSAATLSGAFGGLLAYAISKMDGLGGKPGWAWIFIIEGLMTFVVACAAPFMMADFPEQAKFLTTEEKARAIHRLAQDAGASGEAPYSRVHIVNAFKDWRTYAYMLIYIGVAEPLYSLALFTPTIISELGKWTRAQSNLLSTPPYFLAFFITLGSAYYSDRLMHRGYFNVFWMAMVIVGYSILLAVNPREKPGVAYFALFLCVGGVAPCISNTITWCGGNIGPSYKRATSLGLMFSLGNSGGIVSSLVYFSYEAPRFRTGHATGLGFAAMAWSLSLLLSWDLKRENARREHLYGSADSAITPHSVGPEVYAEQMRVWGLDGKTQAEIEALGDRHPGFRYLA